MQNLVSFVVLTTHCSPIVADLELWILEKFGNAKSLFITLDASVHDFFNICSKGSFLIINFCFTVFALAFTKLQCAAHVCG